MDKETKKKIQQLWRNRLLVGVFSIGLFGCSLGLFRSTLKHRPQQPSWVLELSQSVEDLTNEDNSVEQTELVLDKIFDSCEKRKLSYCALKVSSFSIDYYTYNDLVHEQDVVLSVMMNTNLYHALMRLKMFEQALEERQKREQVVDQARKREQVLASLHELKLELKQLQELEQELVKHRLLELSITKELEQKHGLKLVQGSDLESYLNNEPERQRIFLVSVTFLSLSVILLLISLFTLNRLQSSHNLPHNSHLIAFLPEECVAEMGALAKRMKKENASSWEIRLRLLEEFVTLIWVFYIQIKLENLSLPFQNNQIDE